MRIAGKSRKTPFVILRGSKRTLVEQVADGLRGCIASGYYKSGDVLPSTRDFAERLGVSRRITREAVSILVDSGLISARPGAGCVVLGKNERTWRGNVLLVSRGDWGSYYVQKFAETFSAVLLKSGYLVTQLVVPSDGTTCDCSGLDAALTFRYDLVFQVFDSPEIESRLAASSCRYVVLGDPGAPQLPARSGTGLFYKQDAAKELVRQFVRCGVKSVLVAGIFFYDDFKLALRRAKLRTKWMALPCLEGFSSPEGVQRAALRSFLAWTRETAKADCPDAILFTDDYTASGALTAFDVAGIQTPANVGVVTMSNAGLGPVWHKELTRLEVSPQEDGATAADYVLRMLSGTPVAPCFLVKPTYVAGETLRLAGHSQGSGIMKGTAK